MLLGWFGIPEKGCKAVCFEDLPGDIFEVCQEGDESGWASDSENTWSSFIQSFLRNNVTSLFRNLIKLAKTHRLFLKEIEKKI